MSWSYIGSDTRVAVTSHMHKDVDELLRLKAADGGREGAFAERGEAE